MWLSYRNMSYAYSARNEHPAHGPIHLVWGDNVGRFYMMGTKEKYKEKKIFVYRVTYYEQPYVFKALKQMLTQHTWIGPQN